MGKCERSSGTKLKALFYKGVGREQDGNGGSTESQWELRLEVILNALKFPVQFSTEKHLINHKTSEGKGRKGKPIPHYTVISTNFCIEKFTSTHFSCEKKNFSIKPKRNHTFFGIYSLKNWYFSLHIVVTNSVSAPENKEGNRILTECIRIKSIHSRTKAM